MVRLLQLGRIRSARAIHRTENYSYLVGNATFNRSLLNNGLIIAVSLLRAVAACARDRADGGGSHPGRSLVPDDLFLPYVLADVAAGLIWHFMFDGSYGLASLVTGALGLAPYYLLADKTWAFSAVLIVAISGSISAST